MAAPSTPVLETFAGAAGPLSANWDVDPDSGHSLELDGSGHGINPDFPLFGAGSMWVADSFGPYCEGYLTITTRPSDGSGMSLYTCYDPVNYYVYDLSLNRDDAGGDTFQLGEMAPGGSVASPLAAFDWQDGDSFWVQAEASAVLVYQKHSGGDWTPLLTYTRAFPTLGAGYLAITSVADAVVDDFGGGGIAPTDWTDAVRSSVAAKLEVDWDKDGTYTDESAYLLADGGARGTCSTLMPWQLVGGTQNQPSWTATFVLHNTDNRFSATNASGPYYASIRYNKGHGIPVRFSVGIDNGAGGYTYTQIFQGYIDTLVVNSTATSRVTMNCIDNSQPLLQDRKTTTLYIDETASSWLTVLATLGGVASTSLDPGRCNIPFAWLDDEQLWPEMNKVAHSDAGLIYFNQAGTLVFENCETWVTLARHTASQYTFTVSRWEDMAPAFSWADVYNEVVCQFQPRALRGRQEVWIYEQADRMILPGEVRTIEARLRYPCAAVLTPVANVDYRIIGYNGDDLTGDVTVTDFTVYAQRCEIELTNASASRAAHIHSFRLVGVPLYGYPAGQVKLQATGSDMGDPTSGTAKTLQISGNEYIQTLDQAQLIAASLRDRVQKCRLTYHVVNVPGIPDLIPGDLVTVVEAGSGVNATGYIISYSWAFSKGAFDFTAVDILDATNWTPYTASQYFILGTDVLAASNSKRVYY